MEINCFNEITSNHMKYTNPITLGRQLTTYATYDWPHLQPQENNKQMNKLIINQDVLLKTPMKSTILTKRRQGPTH
jgi:hypothetical protein